MLSELRAALMRSATSGSHGEELKPLLSRAAADARSKGLQAEQMLIQLKELWYSLPPKGPQSVASDVQSRLLEQLIAHSIREYYGT